MNLMVFGVGVLGVATADYPAGLGHTLSVTEGAPCVARKHADTQSLH